MKPWEQEEADSYWRRAKMVGWVTLYIVILIITCLFLCIQAHAEEWSDDEIVEAIYQAEGKESKKPFGILSVSCEGYQECRKICSNTVRNNRKRFEEYGRFQFGSYLEFLASRYAPVGARNDPSRLNRHWIKNVKFFLRKGRAGKWMNTTYQIVVER